MGEVTSNLIVCGDEMTENVSNNNSLSIGKEDGVVIQNYGSEFVEKKSRELVVFFDQLDFYTIKAIMKSTLNLIKTSPITTNL